MNLSEQGYKACPYCGHTSFIASLYVSGIQDNLIEIDKYGSIETIDTINLDYDSQDGYNDDIVCAQCCKGLQLEDFTDEN